MRSIPRDAVSCRAPAAACLCSSKLLLKYTPQLKQRRDHIRICTLSDTPARALLTCQATPRAAAVVAAAAQATATGTPVSQPAAAADSANDWRSLLIGKSTAPGQLVKLALKGKIKGDTGLVNIKPAGQQAPSAAAAAAAAARTDGDGSSGNSSSGVDADKGSMPYKQLTMRPVMLKGKVMLQMSLLTARQDITKNFNEHQAAAALGQLLQLPWSSATLLTVSESVAVQISRKGKAQVQVKPNKQQQQGVAPFTSVVSNSNSSSQGSPISPQQQPQQQQAAVSELFSSQDPQPQQPQPQPQQVLISLQHDRVKATPINGSVADPFLYKIGLQTVEGRIKANMQAKFTQINEFLKLLAHSRQLEQLGAPTDPSSSSSSSSRAPVHILDAGCGSSHLTFGTFHYLHNVMGLPVRLSGVDTNRALMQRSNKACEELGIADVAQFHSAAIRDFPKLDLPPPDIVLALHACDTATDEALAVGVSSGAQVIMSVPCCQKDIQRQFQRQQQQQRSSGAGGGPDAPPQQQQQQQLVRQLFEPLLDHGILKQRQLDLLTDTFRAQLLRLAGYKTDVVEFVSTEHTPRNLLIRAVKRRKPLSSGEAAEVARQYKQLRDAWGVKPCLEKLLHDSFEPHIIELLKG